MELAARRVRSKRARQAGALDARRAVLPRVRRRGDGRGVAPRTAPDERTRGALMLLVTGGAGFIGSNFVLSSLAASDEPVVNFDKLTYAGNLHNLDSLRGEGRHVFVRGDICDRAPLKQALERHRPRAIVHFAAESHVDRSIVGPAEFVDTNIVGTWTLLEEVRAYWAALPGGERDAFRFLH